MTNKIDSTIESLIGTTIDISSPDATIAFAKRISTIVTPGTPILLYGTLGTGKTFFTTHLIRTLMNNENEPVPSPTFSILQQYITPAGSTISHYDLYRIKDANELFELNIDEALQNHITIIEWPEIIDDYIRDSFPYIAIKFTITPTTRTVSITSDNS